MNGYASNVTIPTALRPIQTATTAVCVTRKSGVPKKRANASALSANQSGPNVDARCRCGRWKRKGCLSEERGAGRRIRSGVSMSGADVLEPLHGWGDDAVPAISRASAPAPIARAGSARRVPDARPVAPGLPGRSDAVSSVRR